MTPCVSVATDVAGEGGDPYGPRMFGLFGAKDARPSITRRRLLRLGLGTGVVVAGGLGTVGWGLLKNDPPAAGLAVLSDREARVIVAVADAYFPVGTPFGVAANDIDILGPLDVWFGRQYPAERRGLRALLRGLDRWPRLAGYGDDFTALDLATRVDVLKAFDESSITERRLLGTLLRTVILMPVFEDERLLAAIGFRHGCVLPVTTSEDAGIG